MLDVYNHGYTQSIDPLDFKNLTIDILING